MRALVKTFGSLRALDGLDLRVERGTVHGFLGPNGAGKSTTIRVLLGMYRRDSGSVRVLGLDPSKPVRLYSKGNRQKVALVAALAAPCELLVLDEPTSGLDPLQSEVFLRAVRQAADEGRTVLLSSHLMAEVDRLCEAVTIIKDGRCVESGQLSQLRHLRSSRITCVLPPGATGVELPATTDERGRLVVSVPSEQVPRALQALTQAGATELTCTPVDLGELFLEHYTAVAR